MPKSSKISTSPPSLLLDGSTIRLRRMVSRLGEMLLFAAAFLSVGAVFAILYYIARDAIPFFQAESLHEFFGSTRWYPSREDAEFGAGAIFYGSLVVTAGAVFVAVPLGVCSAVALSELLPFSMRQYAKPMIELLASIPSVAYGFFALVIFAPLLQNHGGTLISASIWLIGVPVSFLASILLVEFFLQHIKRSPSKLLRLLLLLMFIAPCFYCIWLVSIAASTIEIESGTNALNVSIILGVMALPTVVSVSEDALQAVSKDIRMASYGLGATRTETIVKVLLPAAASGIFAAVLLGIMRALGETMVVWMASGNAAQIPTPWYDITVPVRTLTATIAGDMGEADHVTGSSRYHVLFAMAFCLLLFSFVCNLVSEWIVKRSRRKLRGE